MCSSYSFSWAKQIVELYWANHGSYPNYVSRILGKSPDYWAVSLAQARPEWENFKACVKLAERIGPTYLAGEEKQDHYTRVEANIRAAWDHFAKRSAQAIDKKMLAGPNCKSTK